MLERIGGPDRDRTDDLFHAMEARSQLRHRPTCCEDATPLLSPLELHSSNIVRRAKVPLQTVTELWHHARNKVELVAEDRGRSADSTGRKVPANSAECLFFFPLSLSMASRGFFLTFGEDTAWVFGYLPVWFYAVERTRRRSSSKPARPYMERLMSLRRWTCPSTGPLLHGYSRAARNAASSRHRCFANPASELPLAVRCHSGHAAASRSRMMRKNSRAVAANAAISGERR